MGNKADDLIIENNTPGGLTILTNIDSSSRIYFGEPEEDITKGMTDEELMWHKISTVHKPKSREGIRISTSGSIGIGTTNPRPFHTHTKKK